MTTNSFTVHASGLGFTEAPRWHNNKLYFSDFAQKVVRSIDSQGDIQIVAEVPMQPSGLGWLPDGRMLVVSMHDHKVLCQQPNGELVLYADLQNIATGICNDMVVDRHGRAYVGNFGGSNITLDSKVTAKLAMIDTNGKVSVAADDLYFPNGAVLTDNGNSLIIAETLAQRLTVFDIAADGSLYNRRLWADISPSHPDGICQDNKGGIWVATVYNEVIRVEQGGNITERIATPDGCYACALGGENGKRLYLCITGSNGSQIISTEVSNPKSRY
jgi:sugar lactone lactonase YvrE